jgi:hypothetical protein
MKLQPYIEKLNNSSEYKDFQKKYSGAFVVAGFFILDLETGNNVHQVDYYVPSKKKIAAFTLDNEITLQLLDLVGEKVPEKLDIKTKIDLDQLYGILEDEMKNRNLTDDIKKIIVVLQSVEGKKIWNLNCILSGMGILNAHVEDDSRTVLKMEKKSLTDIIKKMPAPAVETMLPQNKEAQNPEEIKKNAEEKIKKLEELEKAIEKEKAELEKTNAKTNIKKPAVKTAPQNAKEKMKKTKSKPKNNADA